MTYEEKLLEVFARFRGDGASEATLERIEKAANAEVWQHLPPEVRSSWRLRLGYSETHPGQIELLPRRLREDGASPAELEAALRAPFAVGEALDEGPKELRGGMAGVSIGFGGSTMPEVPRPRRA
ncbi:MAG TPA: hypothetical protein VLC09_13045, partial [Polyangiaceae bacterium]|nr:hypothetical protein [Polyangiaceae bacterium]